MNKRQHGTSRRNLRARKCAACGRSKVKGWIGGPQVWICVGCAKAAAGRAKGGDQVKRIILHPDDPKCRTSWPDPRGEEFEELLWRACEAPDTLPKGGLLALVAVARVYQSLLTHPAGTENALRCLRELRRAAKEQQ